MLNIHANPSKFFTDLLASPKIDQKKKPNIKDKGNKGVYSAFYLGRQFEGGGDYIIIFCFCFLFRI